MAKTHQVPIRHDDKLTGFHPLTALRSEIENVFDHFSNAWTRLDPIHRISEAFRSPDTDASESKNAYEISVDLPGMDEKHIDLSIVDNVLVLKGEKQEEREQDGKDYYLRERFYGRFQRSFQVPNDVNKTKIAAKYDKGVLTISLPRSKSAKPKARRIAVLGD
ncbi:MAG: Hsp20/alpha crystallin family protein [Gammaproteobacteria bacterium]|nr:Hsp20/alpha crystallin family protein [Gammaproteobacteria bacterium]